MIIKEITPQSGDVLLVPGDIHFDQQDDHALELVVSVSVHARVNTVSLVGDTFESSGISRHGRPARAFRFGRGTIASEARAAAPWLSCFREIATKYRGDRPGGLHVLTGNHEAWWHAVQDEFPGLLDTPWPELYGDTFNGWHVHAEHVALKFGPLLVAHGHRLRGSLARASAASVLANYPGQNTVYGHTHRVDSCVTPSYKYGKPVRHGAWTVGHMKRMDIEAKDRFSGPFSERHLQGFAIITFKEVEGEMRFNLEQVTIDRTPSGKPYCIYRGDYFD